MSQMTSLEIDELYEEWGKSGVSIAAFARSKGLQYTQLYGAFYRRRKKELAESQKPDFVPAVVSFDHPSHTPRVLSSSPIRLKIGRVASLELSTQTSPKWVASLLRELL